MGLGVFLSSNQLKLTIKHCNQVTGDERRNTVQRQQHSLSFLKNYYTDMEEMVRSTSEHITNLSSCVWSRKSQVRIQLRLNTL